jgi:hypothetical protein
MMFGPVDEAILPPVLPRAAILLLLPAVVAVVVVSGSDSECRPWAQACLSSAQPLRADPPPAPRDRGRGGSGRIKFVRSATTSFDPYLTGSSKAQKRWMARHYWRMRGFDPFFARVGALRWAPPTHFAKDLYGIYRDSAADGALLNEHPDWVLRDDAGNPLYIPSDCDGESCPIYAADVGNPAFQRHWISRAKKIFAKGYAGVFIDDVSLEVMVSDGAANLVTPIDPRTRQPMREVDWRRYVASFLERIAAALPRRAEIVHNQGQWWLSHSDRYVKRQVAAADIIELERGYNDDDLTGGGGAFGFETFMAHIGWLHSRGKSVMFEPYDLDPAKQAYAIAAYYLTKSRADAIASSYAADPGHWSKAWDVNLGAPRGRRHRWNGLWRRDYERGIALVNQPGQPSRTVGLRAYRTVSGGRATPLTLGAAQGAVLIKDGR